MRAPRGSEYFENYMKNGGGQTRDGLRDLESLSSENAIVEMLQREKHKIYVADQWRREGAQAAGLVKYNSRRPCKAGHQDPIRYVVGDTCVRCSTKRSAKQAAGVVRSRHTKHAIVKPPFTAEQRRELEAGTSPRYYGSPCRLGHDGLRYRKSHICVRCAVEFGKLANIGRVRRNREMRDTSYTPADWLLYSAAVFL